MGDRRTFSSYLIGADTLLAECAEILLAGGHEIRGIITAAPKVARWARSKRLAVIDAKSDYKAVLERTPFDWLFAITHLAIIPADVLALATRGAINFHDGPLPGYAGLNTPAWGLIRREPTWGITFHLMTAGIDAGDIVKQRHFEVAPRETSISLNTRNFATAIECFGELVQDLERDTLERTPQDPSGRFYASRHLRPEAGGLLDLTRPAVELEALVRALDFGRYANPLGLAKVVKGSEIVAVTRAEARPDEGGGNPGLVVETDSGEITIATGEGLLALQGFATVAGEDLSVKVALERLGVEPGVKLDVGSADVRARLDAQLSSLAKHEAFWTERLSWLEPVEIPYASNGARANEPRYARLPLDIPPPFVAAVSGARPADAVLAAFAAYLGRIVGKEEFRLAFHDDALARELGEATPYVSPEVPIVVKIDLEQPFTGLLDGVQRELALVRSKRTFPSDLLARVPELRANAELVAGRMLSVGVAVVDDPDHFTPARASTFTLAIKTDGTRAICVFDAHALSTLGASEMRDQLATLLASIGAATGVPLATQDILSEETKRRLLEDWNNTEKPFATTKCVHHTIEEQVERTPDAEALVFEGRSLTYRELNARANQLAAYLRKLGVGPDRLVGIFVERSLELVISALAAQKAGGAYLPLDPAYPRDRIAFMVEDSKVGVILTTARLIPELPPSTAKVVDVETEWPEIAKEASENVRGTVEPHHLAYVIYTSGSTGRPKGVEVEHRNVVNFFAGMDDRLPKEPPGAWLAVTSLSFDIHVLELSYTLARGFKVVVYLDRNKTPQKDRTIPKTISRKGMQFGLFMWGNDDAPGRQKYELMLKGSRFFDEHGFDSVWTPERHFHAFGGPYPNPSVTGAAIAAITAKVKIRAGSCVSPLHHPIRIAEEWSVIDNLSDGRVGLSFAAGWQPNDFILRPESHKNAKRVMFEQIETVKKLWRGEAVEFTNPLGQTVPLTTLPRPVQKELPIWVTTAGNPETYREAGHIGANVLTHLLGQSVDEVATKIQIYREALKEKGFDPASGTVTLMLHTFIGHDVDEVRELVRQPMKDYLGASVSLVKNFAWAFPAFKRPGGADAKPEDIDLASLSQEELDAILEFAFERYFESSGLFGTPESCMEMVNKLKSIGVDEIACLLDFGVSTEKVLGGLSQLKRLKDLANEGVGRTDDDVDYSIAAQIHRHRITHMQCTPSMARMLLMEEESRQALATVRHMMIGGEAFPVVLAKELGEVIKGTITNMYGPTETTIWSSTHPVKGAPDSIPIGRPIANTQLYVLDRNLQPVPPGVPGELFIGGAGVVRGYRSRPELTAERFVPNPFAKTPGARMYRTGDLARFRRDGVVEFLGRTDHQIKIRGYRIELGEIETMLSKQPGVRECVIVLREDTPQDQRLVAYYVPSSDPIDPGTLKDALRSALPEFMVPSHFAALDALPLTPNGKIDRKQLPSLEALGVKHTELEYVAPKNDIEEKIAKIWQETLNKARVGIEDNFFDIGGHSLLVVRMHRKIKEALDVPVSLTDLYRFPTIRSLTQHLSSEGGSESMQASAERASRRRDFLAKRRRRAPGRSTSSVDS